MNLSLVSILIPAYNAELYIAETLESAIAQTWGNIEIIVVDDGYRDDTLAIAKRYETKGIKVIAQEQNRGQTVALNRCLAEAQGDYIQYLDADDILEPQKIGIQVNRLLNEPQGTLAIAGLKFAAEPTITVINYYRSNSMSSANQIKCIKAKFHVMRKVAESLNGKYSEEISESLWILSGSAAAYLDWETTDKCLNLALKLRRKLPDQLSFGFKIICYVNPYFAIRLREKFIRFFKPHLRKNTFS